MARPGFVRQPGAAVAPRINPVAARGLPVALRLEAGLLLVESVRRAFAAHGHVSGVLDLRDLALGPFGYVMPALARDGRNAAYYSPIVRPPGVTELSLGAMTFGLRGEAPFFHAHGLWREADGRESGGHLLPEETVLARPAEVQALALSGALYRWSPDPEINFTIPQPVADPADRPATGETIVLRLRPNVCLHGALERYCHRHGIAAARIRGGVGSTIGALFEDGREIDRFATEVFLTGGRIGRDAAGDPVAEIETGLIDYAGTIARGTLKRGANPVLMTFELALDVTERLPP